MSLLEGAIKLKEAIHKGDIFEKGKISSREIFLNKKVTRIINSEGIDGSYESFYSEVECITQWIENQDVENYSCFRSRDLDEADLINKVKEGQKQINFEGPLAIEIKRVNVS